MTTSDDVLQYWFSGVTSAPGVASQADTMKRWFAGGPEVDREIRERFADTLLRATRGELDAWADTPRGRLALIVVLDQFSRNVFRDTARAYAQDTAALRLAVVGYDRHEDVNMSVYEHLFFNMPYVHAEDIAMQNLAVAHCETMLAQAKAPAEKQLAEGALKEANRHRSLIVRFGRFPARNEALGRSSTEEERAFLTETASH